MNKLEILQYKNKKKEQKIDFFLIMAAFEVLKMQFLPKKMKIWAQALKKKEISTENNFLLKFQIFVL